MAEETDKVDLIGTYRHKVDVKGRMSLPATFRKVLSTDLVVTPNPKDECLYVFEQPSFNAWVEQTFVNKFGGYDNTNDLHIRLKRKLKARAGFVSIDSAGRIILPNEQREAVGIDKDVAVVGNTGYFEVWDVKRYDQVNDDTDLSLLFD